MCVTCFQYFESNESIINVDLASLLEDFGQAGIVHPDNLPVCLVFVTLCCHHTDTAALFKLHLLLHFLYKDTHTHTEWNERNAFSKHLSIINTFVKARCS